MPLADTRDGRLERPGTSTKWQSVGQSSVYITTFPAASLSLSRINVCVEYIPPGDGCLNANGCGAGDPIRGMTAPFRTSSLVRWTRAILVDLPYCRGSFRGNQTGSRKDPAPPSHSERGRG